MLLAWWQDCSVASEEADLRNWMLASSVDSEARPRACLRLGREEAWTLNLEPIHMRTDIALMHKVCTHRRLRLACVYTKECQLTFSNIAFKRHYLHSFVSTHGSALKSSVQAPMNLRVALPQP
jgi:hypothetical protein